MATDPMPAFNQARFEKLLDVFHREQTLLHDSYARQQTMLLDTLERVHDMIIKHQRVTAELNQTEADTTLEP